MTRLKPEAVIVAALKTIDELNGDGMVSPNINNDNPEHLHAIYSSAGVSLSPGYNRKLVTQNIEVVLISPDPTDIYNVADKVFEAVKKTGRMRVMAGWNDSYSRDIARHIRVMDFEILI